MMRRAVPALASERSVRSDVELFVNLVIPPDATGAYTMPAKFKIDPEWLANRKSDEGGMHVTPPFPTFRLLFDFNSSNLDTLRQGCS